MVGDRGVDGRRDHGIEVVRPIRREGGKCGTAGTLIGDPFGGAGRDLQAIERNLVGVGIAAPRAGEDPDADTLRDVPRRLLWPPGWRSTRWTRFSPSGRPRMSLAPGPPPGRMGKEAPAWKPDPGVPRREAGVSGISPAARKARASRFSARPVTWPVSAFVPTVAPRRPSRPSRRTSRAEWSECRNICATTSLSDRASRTVGAKGSRPKRCRRSRR